MKVLISKLDNKIKVVFDYDLNAVAAIKNIPRSKFIPQNKGGPYWTVALDIDICRMLRKAFGKNLVVDQEINDWFVERTTQTQVLSGLARAEDAELDRLHDILPRLYDFVNSRPYQKADIKFMATADAPANTNQPGTGKTVELIGSIFEGEIDEGAHLVAAPLTSLDVVWEWELDRWQYHPVLVARGGRRDREEVLWQAQQYHEQGEPFWLVVNPAMIQYKRSYKKCDYHKKKKSAVHHMHECPDCEELLTPTYQEFFDFQWKTFTIDEFHLCGLTNTASLTSLAANAVLAEKKFAMSGTPMRGKPIKLYGMLHFLHPEEFTSKWAFADHWLEVSDSGYGKVIGGIRKDREEAFFEMLDRYLLRRTKAEVLKQLPPKQYIIKSIPLEPGTAQRRQYKEFANAAAIKIEDENLSATSILAEYTRLKQFADAAQDVKRELKVVQGEEKEVLELYPRMGESNKIAHIEEILKERGIDPEDPDGDEQVVIFSQFTRFVNMLCKYLQDKGYEAEKLTGETSQAKRTELVRAFQSPLKPLRVLVMNTLAGGVAITLDRASTAIFCDETWVPDEQEQAEDRVHRGSRIHQVTVYKLRSKNTIEELVIAGKLQQKQDINDLILDIRRQLKDDD